MSYQNILDPKKHDRVYARLHSRIALGEREQQALIDRVAKTVIRDKLVPPHAVKFDVAQGNVTLRYPNDPQLFTIHRHALNQLAAKVGLPMTYVSMLHDGRIAGVQPGNSWPRDLLAYNLQELYAKTPFRDRSGTPKFLHRIVGTELRGFLSRRFNRHLASAPLLRSFLDTCELVGAKPAEAVATDVRLSMRCFLPYVFEPIRDEFVVLGVEWANSDFGAGRLAVSVCLWLATTDRTAVLDKSISRVHIGSVIEDVDVEMSDETYLKEAETQSMAIADTVRKQLSTDNVERLLEAIAAARQEAIPWHKLRGQLGRFLNKKELESLKQCLEDEIIDLPPVGHDAEGRPVANAYWAMAALAKLANKTDDTDRKLELQHAAGSFINIVQEGE